MEKGFFGNLFDFNKDGKLDAIERAADFMVFEELMEDESETDEFQNDDFETEENLDDDDNFDEEEDFDDDYSAEDYDEY